MYWNQDESFLEPEIRNEYYVNTRQKKIWAVQLDLFNQFDTVCKQNDIKYFAFWGTLLGTIRHKGFIPWDDDFDVAMTRENYDKFVGLQECFKDPYYLHIGPKDEMHYRHHCRLRNSNTLGFVKGYNDINSNNGIYIDINVLDGWSSKKRSVRVQRAVRMLYSRMIAVKHKAPGEIDGRWKWINYILKFISCFFSFSTIARLDYKNTTKYNTTSGFVGCIDAIDEVEAKFLYSDVSVLVDADFEGYKIPIPSNYDNVLKELYGDYMKFPPVEKRGKYHEDQIFFDPDIPYKEYIAKYGYPL